MTPVALTPIDEALIGRVRDQIVAACNPVKLYLFGSAAQGTAQPGSDLDLLIVTDLREDQRPFEKAGQLRRLFDGWFVPFDILVQTPEEYERTRDRPGHVARIATHDGRLLYQRGRDYGCYHDG